MSHAIIDDCLGDSPIYALAMIRFFLARVDATILEDLSLELFKVTILSAILLIDLRNQQQEWVVIVIIS